VSDYVDDTTKSRRLATLRAVRENEGAINESLLRKALHMLGFRGRFQGDDALAGDAEMMGQAGLVRIVYYEGRVRTLEITKRGRSYLERHIDPIPGIDYPEA
jgi:G:T-mismatch repair DNA endonuclease (very short patch repair protein)